jgi:hypothetical protein
VDYSSYTRRISPLILALALLLTTALIPGCGSKTTTIKPLELYILSVNTDQRIEILLVTNDTQGEPTQLEGVMDIGLWYWTRNDVEFYPDFKIDNQLVQKWQQIPLTLENYTDSGAVIFLAYDHPHRITGASGYMEITLQTSDGETLVVSRDDLQLVRNATYTP